MDSFEFCLCDIGLAGFPICIQQCYIVGDGMFNTYMLTEVIKERLFPLMQNKLLAYAHLRIFAHCVLYPLTSDS